ncbi:MAG: FHA domain-containing protein [Pseudobdellovibrio sp.]
MARLKVILRGAQISDLSLNPDKEYVGGRKESCDIRLQAEKGISREHFKLKFEDDGKWHLTSLSRFGEIYSLGQRVENLTLEHGQTFQIPPYEFVFNEVAEATDMQIRRETQIDENERTVVGVVQQVPYFKMLDSQGQVREMLRLEVGDLWVAGRDPSCQIVIPDQRVSRRQFEIRKINGLYSIIDLASVNGTFLNGSPVSGTEPEPLKSGDAITVLDNTMYFELHDPNFQYRMDRIDVPPIVPRMNIEGQTHVEDIEDPLVGSGYDQSPTSQEPVYMGAPSVQPGMEYNSGFQQTYAQQSSGGPFTGMPPYGQAQSQFYNFQQQQAVVEPTPWQKFTQNKPLFATVIILILAGSYYISEMFNQPVVQNSQQIANIDDPFLKLNKEDQDRIKMWYSTAEKALKQQQFSTAKENLDRVHSILPLGYKDSKAHEAEAQNGELTIITQQETERREKEEAKNREIIAETIAKCEKIINPDVTEKEMQFCLSPATIIQPDNPDISRLVNQVAKIVEDRRIEEQKKQTAAQQALALKELFLKAEDLNQKGFPRKTIKAYKEVINSSLNDPEYLKELSKKRIKLIENKIREKNQTNLANAEVFIKEGKLRDGILSLRAALDFDPDNQTLKDKIEKYSNDLRNQVKIMYQESIIDENFGFVDGTENRPGAKDKWKKILELDLEEGDYYRKAFIKLKRYGVI